MDPTDIKPALMKKNILFFYFLLVSCSAFSQSAKVYPTNWWAGMKWNKVQLMVHGEKIAEIISHDKNECCRSETGNRCKTDENKPC